MRITVHARPKLAQQIVALANAYQISVSDMAGRLLEAAVAQRVRVQRAAAEAAVRDPERAP
jgi:hypothetical protein